MHATIISYMEGADTTNKADVLINMWFSLPVYVISMILSIPLVILMVVFGLFFGCLYFVVVVLSILLGG